MSENEIVTMRFPISEKVQNLLKLHDAFHKSLEALSVELDAYNEALIPYNMKLKISIEEITLSDANH